MLIDQAFTSVSDGKSDKARHHSTSASFGDEGVTATANSHGHLLQISRYFGNEVSRLFCVDLTDILPPNSNTGRMQKIQHYIGDPDGELRSHIERPEELDPRTWKANAEVPTLEFWHDRWPRFITATPKFDLSIQYIISEKIVYQIYNFELHQGEDYSKFPLLALDHGFRLRDLNFIAASDGTNCGLEGDNSQRFDYENYSDRLSPDNNYIIRTRKLCETTQNNQDTIVLLITPLVNKRRQCLNPRPETGDYQIILDQKALHHLGKEGRLEITLAYQLELISSREMAQVSLVSTESCSTVQALLDTPF
ncbi:hypothetical protein GGI35DRAFT_309715 [Trichoderma velutinum]